jgi:hypothetical protein
MLKIYLGEDKHIRQMPKKKSKTLDKGRVHLLDRVENVLNGVEVDRIKKRTLCY